MTQARARVITASYRIVTPVFCAGADRNSAELRLPSLKGALRFWWRTLMWGTVTDHNELRRQEAELFGASDSRTGQSKVRLRITDRNIADVVRPPAIFEDGRLLGAHYLGYGVMEAFGSRQKGTEAGQLTRGMIPGGTFTVECRFAPLASGQQFEEVRRAFVLLGTVGGIGSKSRKGFGSLTITHLAVDGEQAVFNSDVSGRLQSAVCGLSDRLPDWTAWHTGTRIVVARSNEAERPVELLDKIGREQVHFRSWGSNNRGKLPEHRTLDIPSEQNFEFDHDLSKRPRPGQYPHRVAFGLPHNYQTGGVKPRRHERRASPLIIHVDQISKTSPPVVVVAFLPSQFLGANEQVNAFGNTADLSHLDEFWYPLHAFLDRLVSDDTKQEERPGYERFPASNRWRQKKTSISAQEVNLG